MGQIVCTEKGILAVEQNKVLIPPAWNKTFAWGYADLSCRLGTYESDKVYTASLHPFVVATTRLDRGRLCLQLLQRQEGGCPASEGEGWQGSHSVPEQEGLDVCEVGAGFPQHSQSSKILASKGLTISVA